MKLKLVGHRIKSSGKSTKPEGRKKSKFIFVLFAIGVFIFAAALALYAFQNKIPHLNLDSSDVVMPISLGKMDIDFPSAFNKNGLAFEAIKYATGSPTLIVKLPDGAYAYFDSTKDPTSAIKVLKDILYRTSIEDKNKKIKYIDLRFEKAIVKF